MPLPRKPRPNHGPKGTRASRRNARKSAWVLAKLQERFERFAQLLEAKRQEDIANGDYPATDQEKAPDLAAEGFSSFFREKEETLSG